MERRIRSKSHPRRKKYSRKTNSRKKTSHKKRIPKRRRTKRRYTRRTTKKRNLRGGMEAQGGSAGGSAGDEWDLPDLPDFGQMSGMGTEGVACGDFLLTVPDGDGDDDGDFRWGDDVPGYDKDDSVMTALARARAGVPADEQPAKAAAPAQGAALKRKQWTLDEDILLLAAVKIHENKWEKITEDPFFNEITARGLNALRLRLGNLQDAPRCKERFAAARKGVHTVRGHPSESEPERCQPCGGAAGLLSGRPLSPSAASSVPAPKQRKPTQISMQVEIGLAEQLRALYHGKDIFINTRGNISGAEGLRDDEYYGPLEGAEVGPLMAAISNKKLEEGRSDEAAGGVW